MWPFQENLAFLAPFLPASHGTAATWHELKRQMSVSSGCLGSSCLFKMNSEARQAWGSFVHREKGNAQSPFGQCLHLLKAYTALRDFDECDEAREANAKHRTARPKFRQRGYGKFDSSSFLWDA